MERVGNFIFCTMLLKTDVVSEYERLNLIDPVAPEAIEHFSKQEEEVSPNDYWVHDDGCFNISDMKGAYDSGFGYVRVEFDRWGYRIKGSVFELKKVIKKGA